MSGLTLFVRTLATAFGVQFCREIGLNASGEVGAIVFGMRTMYARLNRSREAV